VGLISLSHLHSGADDVVDHNFDPAQKRAVLEFILFLNDTMSRSVQRFEQQESCSPAEATVLGVLARSAPMMVKEIATALPGMDPSKLTRLLDSLEKHGYATRTLNREHRRSFLVGPTGQGLQMLGRFTQHLEVLAEGMLASLTPAERLVLVDLFTKVQANWDKSVRE